MTHSKQSQPSPFTTPRGPLGSRPPQRPDLPLLGVRLLLLLCIITVALRDVALNWVLQQPLLTSVTTADQDSSLAALPERLAAMLGATGRVVLNPPVYWGILLIVVLGAAVLVVELAVSALLLATQTTAMGRAHYNYLRIRTPQPTVTRGAQSSASGEAFFHAIHRILPQHGTSWLALTLSAQPDEPVTWGAVVGGGKAKQRANWGAALRKIVSGLDAGALVDEHPDPLAAAAQPGTRAFWREYVLALPPAYPLRVGERAEGDLLAPLVAALRGRGAASYIELSVTVRSRHDWSLLIGWRVRALRRLLQLRARQQYALQSDAQALQDKLDGPAYNVTVRVIAIAKDDMQNSAVQAELDAIEAVLFAQYQARSGSQLQRFVQAGQGVSRVKRIGLLQPRWGRLRNRAPRVAPPMPLLLPMMLWRGPSILSAGELAGLWHLPTPGMGTLARWLPCRFLPAPPHAFLPPSPPPAASEPRIVVGHALRSDGELAPVGPSLRDLRQMVHLTAGMGAGKSRLLANVCQQLLDHGFILGDGKGDDDAGSLVATVRALIPLEVEARLVILDVLDTEWPIGINPLTGIDLARPGGVDMALGQVLAILGRLDPEVWAKSMGMQQYIRMGALLVLEAEPTPTMAHIKQALVDDGYRATLLRRCTNIEVRTFWEVTFPKTGDQQTVSLDALLRRFDNLLATETTRYLLTQPVSTFEFGRAIVRAAFGRSGSDQSRTTYPLIIDEFQVFLNAGASEDISTAMTRLRSLGIGGIYAHQLLTQLGDLKDIMLINAQSRIVLKTQEPDASVYGRQYAASGITAIDIANQDANEHQYAVLQCGGQTAGPLSLRPLPWPEPLPIVPPPAPAQPWQQVLPADAHQADATIVQLVYGSYSAAHFGQIVAGLAHLAADEWAYLGTRWQAISEAQRAYILAHPGAIPDQFMRQRWLSRLWAALPRVLVAASYQRQRWMVVPGETPVRVAPPRRSGRGVDPARGFGRPANETWGYAVNPASTLALLPDDGMEG